MSVELIERAERREPRMSLGVGDATVSLRLDAWEQAIHTPALALATMLHRNVVIAHGTNDAWAAPDESRLIAAVVPDALRLEVAGAGHDLAEATDERIAEIAAALALATMLHRNVVVAHGTSDAWADPDESRLIAAVVPDALRMEVDGAGHDLAEAPDERIGELADALAGRIEPRELPPVLLAIEEMGSG